MKHVTGDPKLQPFKRRKFQIALYHLVCYGFAIIILRIQIESVRIQLSEVHLYLTNLRSYSFKPCYKNRHYIKRITTDLATDAA
jgi:hypothetical protein